jgi:hypothetical protein
MMGIKEKYIRDLLFILYAAYFAQGGLYNQGALIFQVVLLIILFICGFYFFKILIKNINKPLFYKAITALLLINIIGLKGY